MTTLIVPARFCGPPSSGNGGWTAGALAAHLTPGPDDAVRVSLRRPPPLDVAMPLETADGAVSISHDGDLVASATSATGPLAPVAPVPEAEARAAGASYAGLTHHPFPTCVGCGTAREPGDGLRIFPGVVAPGRTAATWTPAADVDAASVWASIDCISAWAADIAERAMVLGEMTAVVHAVPDPGAVCVVTGEARTEEGRKIGTAASLYDAAGGLLATAEHTWITVDPATFGYAPS